MRIRILRSSDEKESDLHEKENLQTINNQTIKDQK